MATVQDHYANGLSDIYAWMLGGFSAGIQKNTEFFNRHQIAPKLTRVAVDLGAGCGFQSIPLAKVGFSVMAFDTDEKLLSELTENAADLQIQTILDDLINFETYISQPPELFVCMTDTILHLESKQKVITLFQKVFSNLLPTGQFIISFRDLLFELDDLDRFIPVKSDAQRVFTCFLEYEPETVKVHDLIYTKEKNEWHLSKSFYRKLRLSKEWVVENLERCGFTLSEIAIDNGLITIFASKPTQSNS